ncbi:MAG: ribosome biogenesis/translation initiation ATPase RLI [Ignisphaera sp.]
MKRIATIDYELCQPNKCGIPCIRFCPINKTRPYKAIELSPEKQGKPIIYEDKCIACGICVRKCPFKAIHIVNLPTEIEERIVHRYGTNAFSLYGLPLPVENEIVGVLGPNGAGKTTAMRILSGFLIPNFGILNGEPSKDRVLEKFKGTQFYDYFSKLYGGKIKVVHKVQYVEAIQSYVRHGTVYELLRKFDERGILKDVVDHLRLGNMLSKEVKTLSGGELQKFAVAIALERDANAYIFDEPTAFLDIRERINLLRALTELKPKGSYIFVVDHDIMFLDYVADLIVIVYGIPAVFGYFSKTYPAKAGIDYYLKGFLPAENMRIRDEQITFRLHDTREDISIIDESDIIFWSHLYKKLGSFELSVEEGKVKKGEVIGIIGPNAIGKTTFIRILAGELEPDKGYVTSPALKISYKPQYLSRKESNCVIVEECLKEINKNALEEGNWLYIEVIKRIGVDRILKKEIESLSGGELQKFYIARTLISEADVYLLDEPSSHIDVEDQLSVARAIKRVARIRKAPVFVIDHNILLIDYAVDRLMVFTGEPGVRGSGMAPSAVSRAFNTFLKEVGITVRRDPETGRPRINKPGSYLDREQKALGQYFYTT